MAVVWNLLIFVWTTLYKGIIIIWNRTKVRSVGSVKRLINLASPYSISTCSKSLSFCIENAYCDPFSVPISSKDSRSSRIWTLSLLLTAALSLLEICFLVSTNQIILPILIEMMIRFRDMNLLEIHLASITKHIWKWSMP